MRWKMSWALKSRWTGHYRLGILLGGDNMSKETSTKVEISLLSEK